MLKYQVLVLSLSPTESGLFLPPFRACAESKPRGGGFVGEVCRVLGEYPWASWVHSQVRCPQWLMGSPFNGISDIVSRICVRLIVCFFFSESWLLFSQMPTKAQSYSLAFNILSGMRDKCTFLTVTHTAEKPSAQ